MQSNMITSTQNKRLLAAKSAIEPRATKLRKGTQSCWECKRRKVRCNLIATSDSVCDGCKRRGTECVSQESPDNSKNAFSKIQLQNRINQLENLLQSLSDEADHISADQTWPDLDITCSQTQLDFPPSTEGGSSNTKVKYTTRGLQTKFGDEDKRSSALQTSPYSQPQKEIEGCQNSELKDDLDLDLEGISRTVIDAWPDERALDLILGVTDETSGLFHGTMYAPFPRGLHEQSFSMRDALQPPVKELHPVLIAQKLLTLAIYLQRLPTLSMQILDEFSVDYSAIMSNAVKTVRIHVTCNEAFIDSIEGIDCILMESIYENNAGNLRCAWHLTHRAIVVAQLMGLHLDTMPKSVIKFLNAETRRRIYPDYMWFRLVQMDRYLSLMLGLVQGTTNNTFAEHRNLENCAPMDRMQRMVCAAAGHLLQRNEIGMFTVATTHMIEQMLQEAAASLPPSWWLNPIFDVGAAEEAEAPERVIRMMDQLTHYHLLTQLHLPHLIRPNSDESQSFDRSRRMVVDASREILLRFISLKGSDSFTRFCCGINLLAFLACVAICIVYVDARLEERGYAQTSVESLGSATEQHLVDRTTMQLTLNTMESMASLGKDLIASKTAHVLAHLLSMEADSSTLCIKYVSPPSTERGFGCGGKLSDDDRVLHIHIPHIGTVKFERGSPPGN